jgi:hypothetical protein
MHAGAAVNASAEKPDRAARRAGLVAGLARVPPREAILSRREDTVPYVRVVGAWVRLDSA